MENKPIIGYVNKIETFGLVDGPGVRFIAFLQGCRMRCKYCHNPETWNPSPEVKEWTPQALFDRAYRFKPYWRDNGGITVSGGEPLLQLEFVTEFFRIAKTKGIHTTIDTSGNPFAPDDPEWMAKFDELLKYTDLVMLDLKEMDPEKHRELTQQDNSNILALAKYLSDKGIKMWIRHVLVPDITDDEQGLIEMNAFIKSLKTVERVEILPYHTLGIAKWENLGIPYPLDGVPMPTHESVEKAEALLHVTDYSYHSK